MSANRSLEDSSRRGEPTVARHEAPSALWKEFAIRAPLLIVAVIIIGAVAISSLRGLARPQPHNPFEAGQIVEAWRALTGRPVYEDLDTGHATHMYGALAPNVLAAVYRFTGVNVWAGRAVSLVSGIMIVMLLSAIASRGAPHRPWLVMVSLTVLLSVDLATGNYLSQNRPDMLAILVGLLALMILHHGYHRPSLPLILAGSQVLVVGFFIKQTVAVFALVPVLPALLEPRLGGASRRSVLALLPLAAIIAAIALLGAVHPVVFYYMIAMPKQYSISIDRAVVATAIGLAGFPLFVALASRWAIALKGWADVRHGPGGTVWPWATSAVAVLVPTSAVAYAKAGGTSNSLIPALLATGLVSMLALRDLAPHAFDQARPWEKRLAGTVLLAALILLGAPNLVSALGYRDTFQDYPEVVEHVRGLGNQRVIAPEDPSIPVLALGVAGRNIYFENDARGWPAALPASVRREFDSASVVVDVKGWWADLVSPELLGELGFVPETEFEHYTIWRRALPSR